MARTGPGFCPFAQQVEGVTTFTLKRPTVVGFCDHTAGGFYSTMLQPGFWNPRQTSVHFAIARDGRVAQIINIFDQAWAQGMDATGGSVGPNSPGVTWPPFAAMGKQNPNLYLISTEHEDAITVNGQTRFVPGSEWTREQYEADVKVKRWCVEEIQRLTDWQPLRFGIDSLASHHMFDPVNRKECAGRFWREVYQARLWADLSGGFGAVPPSMEETALAFSSYIHFLRNGFNLNDLSPRDKEAIRLAGESIP